MTQTKTISATYRFTTTFGYDTADRVLTVTEPGGEVVTTTYNAAGQPYSLRGANTYVVSATYSALGQVTGEGFGNTVVANYTYRSDNFRLQRIQVGSSILDRQYGYDAAGNITAINDALSGEGLNYTYDPLNRLTGVSGAFNETYSYNVIGNLTSKAGVTQYYSATQPHAVTGLSNGSSYQYDANGNMTRRVEGGVTYTQTWNIDNRLVSVTKGSQTTSYYYDADGALVRKMEPRGQTLYGNADYQVFTPTLVTVTIPSTFTHKLYMPVAFGASTGACPDTCTYYRFSGQPVAVRSSDSVYWLHGDHLGSAGATTDINGTKVSELRYTPYGQTRYSSGDTPTNKRFTSQEEDSYSNMYLMGARWYSPVLGRFLSPDSIVPRPGDPQSLNRFSYARNSPVTRIDPTGHADTCNTALYSCADYGSDDPYVTSPTPDMAPGVTNGTPYPLLEANVANPNDLHPLAERWVNTHPYYDPFADPQRFSTNWMGEVVPNSMFDFVRTGLMNQLLKHGRQREAEALQGSTVDSLIQLAGAGIYVVGTAMTYGPTGLAGAVGVPHGNSYRSTKLTTLYALIAQKTGELLKWGITSENPPEQRYTRGFMADKQMIHIDKGLRVDMAARERTLTSSFPGPMNHEGWAGKVPWSEEP